MGNTVQNPSAYDTIIINSFTWEKESHQLFDYDTRDYMHIQHRINNNGYLIKKDDNIQYSDQPQQNSHTMLRLLRISQNLVRIEQNHANDHQKQILWTVAQPHREDVLIQQGDIIKLGRILFKIKEVQSKSICFLNPSSQILISQHAIYDTQENKSTYTHKSAFPQCRICFTKQETDTNPLISPCFCSGSLKYIHLSCLRDWLGTKINKKIYQDCLYYSWKKFKCEVCNKNLLECYEKNGKKYEVYEFERPNHPYIIMQLNRGNRLNDEKTSIYICKLSEQKQIKIGRDPDSQIKINDISVSRNHCSLILKHGKVFIQDKKSKFGTLIKFNNATKFLNSIWLQYGRSLIKIQKEVSLDNFCCKFLNDTQYEIYEKK